MKHDEREELKSRARRMFDDAQTDQERARALELLIEAHFYRSAEAYGRSHPEFATYAAHWLEAQKDRAGDLKDSLRLPLPVFEILRKRYPAPRSPRIPPGMSYYHSPHDYKRAMLERRLKGK